MVNRYTAIAVASALSIGICFNVQAQTIELQPGGWYDSVGATTPFNEEDAIDIKDYCKECVDPSDSLDRQRDVEEHLAGNSTRCVRRWVQAGRDEGKHLFASAGIYTLNRHVVMFNGMHLRCESPKVSIFRKERENGRGIFRSHDYSDTQRQQLNDILIENCGFDMNGDPGNFAGAFNLTNVEHVTFRGNRIFDSTGAERIERDRQRQYLVITNAKNILVEKNHFSHGGRIKVGKPGKQLVIRNNKLNFINDNGITVVDINAEGKLDNTSEDILIYGNLIENATVTGIFYGADGSDDKPGLTARRITIFNNTIIGKLDGSCIRGTLPEFTQEIFIANNRCEGIQKLSDGPKREFVSGIHFSGYNTDSQGSITAYNNYIEGEATNSLDNGAFLVGTADVCLLGNKVQNSRLALKALYSATVSHRGNEWGVGELVADASSEVIEIDSDERNNCFVPDFLTITDDNNRPLLGLFSWWNPERGDNFASTDPRWSMNPEAVPEDGGHIPNGPQKSGYTLYRLEGLVFNPRYTQPEGTVPLYSWWNPERGDNFASTDPRWSMNPEDLRWNGEHLPNGRQKSGYTLYRLEGYIFDPKKPQPPNTIPVYSWWNPERGDNFLTTDPEWSMNPEEVRWNGEHITNGRQKSGYTLYRLEGYVYPSTYDY